MEMQSVGKHMKKGQVASINALAGLALALLFFMVVYGMTIYLGSFVSTQVGNIAGNNTDAHNATKAVLAAILTITPWVSVLIAFAIVGIVVFNFIGGRGGMFGGAGRG